MDCSVDVLCTSRVSDLSLEMLVTGSNMPLLTLQKEVHDLLVRNLLIVGTRGSSLFLPSPKGFGVVS